MKKEIIIIILIAIFVIGLNCITQKYTEVTVEIISENLDRLKEEILKNEREKINSKENEIQQNWKERKYWLAYYIEHDELEKIETKISLIKGNTEAKQYEDIIADIEDTKFILKHIQEKYICIPQNIF